MIYSIFFVYLVAAALPVDVPKNAEDVSWCQMLDQDLKISENGEILGVDNTRWEQIEKYTSGKMKSRTNFNKTESIKLTYSEDGKFLKMFFNRFNHTYGIGSTIETMTYDDHGNQLRQETRDLRGKLITFIDYKYDLENRLIEKTFRFEADDANRASSITSVNYDVTGRSEVEVLETLRNGKPDYQQTLITNYNLSDQVVHFTLYFGFIGFHYGKISEDYYEYDNSPDASYFMKKTNYNYQDIQPKVTIELYDSKNRILSISKREADGHSQLLERHQYSEKLDGNGRVTQSEELKYTTEQNTEKLEQKSTSDFEYGSNGIEIIKRRTYSAKGILKSGGQTLYSYKCE
jgi:hypothetical protein